jgi:hypothetical protein
MIILNLVTHLIFFLFLWKKETKKPPQNDYIAFWGVALLSFCTTVNSPFKN